jgi:D-tyrosyl-tRNA(Tyr) deacylase
VSSVPATEVGHHRRYGATGTARVRGAASVSRVRALVQRVTSASVTVGEEVVGAIGPGLCSFVGVTHADTVDQAQRLAQRLWTLRIFPDDQGLTNRSAEDLDLETLLVSLFTLYDVRS